jgi:hypothetical protein
MSWWERFLDSWEWEHRNGDIETWLDVFDRIFRPKRVKW